MSTKTIFTSLLIFAASHAIAGEYDEEFTLLDIDKSGGISVEEAKGMEGLQEAMGDFDLNGDLVLDKEEFARMKEKMS